MDSIILFSSFIGMEDTFNKSFRYRCVLPIGNCNSDGKYFIRYKGEDIAINNREFEFATQEDLSREDALKIIEGTEFELFDKINNYGE